MIADVMAFKASVASERKWRLLAAYVLQSPPCGEDEVLKDYTQC